MLQEVVAEIPDPDYEVMHREGFGQFKDIDKVKKFFHSRGSRVAKELAERVAAADGNKRLADRQRQPGRGKR